MKKIFPIISAVAIINLTAIFILFRAEAPAPDSVAIHYAIQTTMESGSAQEAAILQTAFLSQAFKEMDTARRSRDNTLQILMYINVSALVFFCVFQYQYYKRKILNPFHKLQSFAGRIAAGDLDIPLEMDRENIFGTFTESFDIMRDELKTARENEIKANKSKKELIASLVHDITTPVASVKSAMDFLLLKINDENDIKIIDSANKKLEQIDTLINDMFHSTLE
jgi:nitrogen fixation/metabolism regulation signal transduction histidine kinase